MMADTKARADFMGSKRIGLSAAVLLTTLLGGIAQAEPNEGVRCTWADIELVERRVHIVEAATLARDFMDLKLGAGTFHVMTACGHEVGLLFTGIGEIDVRDAGPLRGHRLHNTFTELPGVADIDQAIVWASDGAVQQLLEQAGPAVEKAIPVAVRGAFATRHSSFKPESDQFSSFPGSYLHAPTASLGGVLIDVHALSLKRRRKLENLEIRSQWLTYSWNPIALADTGDGGGWAQRRVGSIEPANYAGFPGEVATAEAGSPFAEERPRLPWNLLDAHIGAKVQDVAGVDRDLARVDFNVVLTLEARDGVDAASGVVPLELREGLQRVLGEKWAPIKVLGARQIPAEGEEIGLRFDRVADTLFVHLPEESRPIAGETVRLRLLYRGDVLQSAGTSSFASISGWRWYPTLPVRDRHTTTLTIQAPKFWQVAATGKRIEEMTEGRSRTTTFRETRPVVRAGFQIFEGREKVTASPEEGLPTLRVHLSPQGNAPDAMIEEETYKHLRVLNDLFGPFPYSELEIVETTSGGVTVPGLIAVSRFDSPPDQVVTTRSGGGTLLGALVDQYVAADMGPSTSHDSWLIAGLSVLGECRALEQAGKAGRCRGIIRGQRDRWVDSLEGLGWTSAASLRDPIVGSIWLGSQSGHASSATTRGPLVLDSLRLLVGDETLWAAIRRVAKSYRGQGLNTKSFLLQTQAAAKIDLRGFFAWWVYATPQLPTLRLDYTLTKEDDGTFTLDGSVWVETGSAVEPLPAIIPTILHMIVDGTDPQLRRIVLTEQPRPIRMEGLPGKVKKLALDPAKSFPGRTKVTKTK
jgi:hypothetical protein